MIQKILARVGLSLMLTACGAQNSDVGQEALNAVKNPPVTSPSDPGLPNGNIQMSSPAAESRISVAGKFQLKASFDFPAGMNDVVIMLGDIDTIYMKLGLKGITSLQIDQEINLVKCIAITVTPGPKQIKAIVYPKTGQKFEVPLVKVVLY